MNEFTSLTQAVFINKPKRAKSTKELDQFALQNFEDLLETAPLRQRLYEEQWHSFCAKILNLEHSWHKSLTADVSNFLNASLATAYGRDKVISAAVLVTGLSHDENVPLFDSLVDRAQESFHHLARVSSISCPNVKSAFQNISKQLMQSNTNVSRFIDESRNDFDETADETMDQYSRIIKRQISIHDLKNWYKSKESSSRTVPVVLIVLEDIDMFPDNVVHDLLLLLSCCNFPITLLLGVLHGFAQLEQLVPSETESQFKYKKFYSAVSPHARLEKFLNVIMLDWDFPFRLSGDIIQCTSDYFLSQQFSMKRLLQAYKLCLIEHFRSPTSTLCSSDVRAICEEMPRDFTEEIFEHTLNSIPSWGNFNKGRDNVIKTPTKSPAKKSKILSIPEKYPLEKIHSKLLTSYKTFLDWQIMLLVVYELGTGLPENPIGSNLAELYILAWNGGLLRKESEEGHSPFEKLIRLLNNFSRHEMDRRVSNALNRINGFIEHYKDSKLVNENDSGIPNVLKEFIVRLRAEPTEAKKEPENKPSPRKSERIEKASNWYGIRENMLLDIKASKEDPAYNATRDHIKRFLKLNTENKLKAVPESSIPFAEVFVFNNIQFLRNQISPNVQRRIHTSLCSPSAFLSCDCCKDLEPGSVDPVLPDTSIVYRLFLEQPSKRLNLNDMFMSFKSVIDPSPTNRRGSLSKKAVQKQEQNLLRFKQAVSELQFMGFMKRSKRKPDEVYKQTWTFSANPG